MSAIFQTVIYQPILSLLTFLYENAAFNDLGLAIILLTIIVRVVLFPIFYKGAKDQAIIQKIQPRVREIQEMHGADKERQAKALMELYKEHRVNPFSNILLLLLQLPVFFALFKIFGHEALAFPTKTLFDFLDLGSKSIILAFIAAGIQYFQVKISLPKPIPGKEKDPTAAVGKFAMYFGPALTLMVLFNLPSALGLYWAVSNTFTFIQQVYINKRVRVQ